MMPPQTLHCPTCGASLSSDETTCRYCGTRLQTVACPRCFGMMFVGSKFCPHCGAPAGQVIDQGPALLCPDCREPMDRILLKQTPLQECRTCYGIWLDAKSFERVCADRERQADVLSAPAEPQALKTTAPIVRYRPCPQCGRLMNRVNFAHVSQIIIDQCTGHGAWFDRNELQRVVDFLRGGGTELAEFRAWKHQQEAAHQLQAQQNADALEGSRGPRTVGSAAHAVGWALGELIRRA